MNFNASISTVTSTQFSSIGRIDLNDYYKSDPGRQIIHCQICKLNILKIDVFEHTISKRHKYNKLYVAISQNRCCNVDVDFVVRDIDRLQCRYCNCFLIIDSDRDDFIISHIQDCRHVQNKQACLNRFSFSSKGVSTIEQKSLQPLDSFVTHDMKARKHVKKKAEKIQMKENLLDTTGLMFKEQRVSSNVDDNIDQQYLLFSRDFKRHRGEEVPKFIINGEEATCRCTICMIEMPKTTYNVGGHIDGKKHRKKMLEESIRSINQRTEILDINKKLLPAESVLSKYCKIEETVTDVRGTSNMVAKNVPDNLLFTRDFQRQRGEKVPKFVILGDGGTCQCTICMIEMPQSIRHIGEHIDGIKHRKKMESIRFMDQRTEILDIKKKSPTESVLSKCCKIEGTVTDIRNTNYRVETNASENLLFIEDFQRQRGEVPKFIIFGEGSTCRCTICMIEMTKNIHNVGVHIDGKKHQKKMHKESTRFIEQRTEFLDMKKNSPAESVLSKYCEIEEAVKDIRKTNNPVENNVSANSLFSKDFKRKRGEEVPKFIILGEGATCRCTICMIEIPKTTYNVGGHIDGKKHRKNCASTSTVRSTKILNISKNIDEHMNDEYERLTNMEDFVELLKAQTQKLELPALNKFLPSTSLSNVKNGVYMCTTCDVSVSNNKRCIEQHNNGQKHINKMLQNFQISQRY